MTIRRSSTISSRILLLVVVAALAFGGYWFLSSDDDELVNLSGTWTLTNRVTSSSLERYKGDLHEFTFQVTQDGEEVRGSGEQTAYNGKPARNRYPIWFTNVDRNGNDVVITYSMRGGKPTTGQFLLRIDTLDRSLLVGTFTSTAAHTTGSTTVRIVR